jgi:hypothetical protein
MSIPDRLRLDGKVALATFPSSGSAAAVVFLASDAASYVTGAPSPWTERC